MTDSEFRLIFEKHYVIKEKNIQGTIRIGSLPSK